jgi:hypothetical protein
MDADDVSEAIYHAACMHVKDGPGCIERATPSDRKIQEARTIITRFLGECEAYTTVEELREILGCGE